MPSPLFTQPSPLRSLFSDPAPDDGTAQQIELANTSQFQRGLAAGGYGMSAGHLAAEAQKAELEHQAQQASALRQQALEQATLAQTQGPTINSYTQVHGVGDALNYAAGALGQSIPTMAPSLLAAALTRGRNPLAAYAGATVPAYLQERNEAILNQAQDPVQQAAPIEQRMAASRAKGGANALLESIVPATLAHGFGHAGSSALRTIGTSVLEEGATEGLQEKVGQLAQSYVNPNRDTSQDTQNIIDAGLQGAIGGGGLSTPTALSQGVANRVADTGRLAKTALDKTVELGKTGVDAAKQAVPDSVPEKAGDLADKLFRVPDSDTLDKLKAGVMDPALAKGKTIAETMQAMAQRRAELPQMAKDFVERAKDRYPDLASKVDPNNPSSLVNAVRDIDWKNKLKVFTDNAKAGFEAGKAAGAKHNLMETLSPNDHADLQSILGDHLTPDAADVPSVRAALPSIAARLAALSARTGALDKHDVESMTDLTDTMRSLFKDPQAVADKFAKHMKNAEPSVLSKLLNIESASSDVSKPNSFLQLSLSDKARRSNWDMNSVAKFVDRAVLDPDKANYGVLRNLFGSTAKANQVLDYYQGKMQESGVELDQEPNEHAEEGDFDARVQGINPIDLVDTEKPQYFFQHARSEIPFLKGKLVESDGKRTSEVRTARTKMAGAIKQARAATGHLARIRQEMISAAQYAEENGLDPNAHAERLKAKFTKTRDDAVKQLNKKGTSPEARKQAQQKVFEANKALKTLDVHGLDGFQVMKVTSQDGDLNALDDRDITAMQDVLKRRPSPKDPNAKAKQEAIARTRINFTDPEGKPVALSGESIANVMSDRTDPTGRSESFGQRRRREFAEGVGALLQRGFKLAEGQELHDVVVNRRTELTAADRAEPSEEPLDPSALEQAIHKIPTARGSKELAAKYSPLRLHDTGSQLVARLSARLEQATTAPQKAALAEKLKLAKMVASEALENMFPVPELDTNGMDEIAKQEAISAHIAEIENDMQDLEDLDGGRDSTAYKSLAHALERAEKQLDDVGHPYEADTGLAVGQEKRGKGPVAKIEDKKRRFAADKALAKQGGKTTKHNLQGTFENNGSGDSSASIEAINRNRDEKAAGQTRMLIDRDGTVHELAGVDAVDTHARAGQIIVQRGVGEGEWTVLSRGDDVSRDVAMGRLNRAGLNVAVLHNSQTGGAQGNTLSPEEQDQLIADLQRQRGPDLKVLFEDFHKVGGSGSYTYDAQTGERTIKVALQAINPSLVGWHEALHDFFQMLGGDKSSTKMRKEFTAMVNSQPVIRQLRTLLKDHPAALEQIETDAEERAAYAYQFFLAGQLRVGPDTKTLFGKIHAFLAKILHTISTGARVEQYLAALYQGHLADPNVASQVLAAIQANNPTYADRIQALSDVLGNVPEKLLGSTIERLDNLNLRAASEIGEAMYLPPDKQQDKMLPFLPRRSMAKGVWTNKFFKIMEQYSHDELKQALGELQSHDRAGPIGSQIGKILDELFDYQQTAGVKDIVRVKDAEGNWTTKEVPVKQVKNYFPRVWDLDTIRKNLQGFADVLMQHGGLDGAQAMRIAMDMATLQGLGKSEIDKEDVSYVPFNQSTLEREFDFINDTNAHAFAPFQSQDLPEILATYTDQAVHRAEWARQFGNQGQWLEEKIEEAKQQGATADDIKTIQAAVKGMEGTLGLDMNPKWRQLQAGIITAENLILLPLSLFSQVVDAVAIGARANSYKESLHALDRGFKEVVKSFTKNANTFSKDDRLAMDLGIIDETAMLEAMGMTYQGMYMSKRLRNINRKFFRLNRFEQWNRAMRVQGMVTGQRFILANKDNARYMEELGLSVQDVIETPDGHLAVTELDGLTASQARKIRTALHKFTDTAVLRPNAAHRPIWGNDPRFMLLMHLKQFSFSYQNVILKNMKKELAFGNAKPALVLMGAVPLIMLSNLMKSAMTGNLDSGLTFSQALVQGIERSGLLGTRQFYTDAYNDVANGSMPATSFLGPSFEHALTIVDGLVGTKTPGDVLTRSIPAGAVLKNLTN